MHRYTVQTVQIVRQYWEYTITSDKPLTPGEIADQLYRSDGHCLDGDEVIQEQVTSIEEA
jgi:hypothetical protein